MKAKKQKSLGVKREFISLEDGSYVLAKEVSREWGEEGGQDYSLSIHDGSDTVEFWSYISEEKEQKQFIKTLTTIMNIISKLIEAIEDKNFSKPKVPPKPKKNKKFQEIKDED